MPLREGWRAGRVGGLGPSSSGPHLAADEVGGLSAFAPVAARSSPGLLVTEQRAGKERPAARPVFRLVLTACCGLSWLVVGWESASARPGGQS